MVKRKNKKTYCSRDWSILSSPQTLVGIIITLSGFIGATIIWPFIQEKSEHISLSAQIVSESFIMVDSLYLNLELKAELTNCTKQELKIKNFKCFHIKNNFFTKVGLSSKKSTEIRVTNFKESTRNTFKDSLPPNSSGEYLIFINVPTATNLIQKIRKYLEDNYYNISYKKFCEEFSIQPVTILLEARTNPTFNDDAVIRLFNK